MIRAVLARWLAPATEVVCPDPDCRSAHHVVLEPLERLRGSAFGVRRRRSGYRARCGRCGKTYAVAEQFVFASVGAREISTVQSPSPVERFLSAHANANQAPVSAAPLADRDVRWKRKPTP